MNEMNQGYFYCCSWFLTLKGNIQQDSGICHFDIYLNISMVLAYNIKVSREV